MANLHPSIDPQAASALSTPARRWIMVAARVGYAAKAFVYAAVGTLAVLAAAHTGTRIADSHGAFVAMLSEPFGQALLGLLAAGLAAYAIWRFVQGIFNTDGHARNWRGYAARFGCLFTGLVYVSLSYSALRLFLGLRQHTSGEQQAKSWTALLLAQPYGVWLVALAGGVIVGFATRETITALRADFVKRLALERATPRMSKVVVRCAQIGHLSRAAVFASIGVFLIEAALTSDPHEARGLGGALYTLEQQPYGDWLLGAVGTGFIAYAAYLLLLTVYRRLFVAAPDDY
jgi:hypothetical protein